MASAKAIAKIIAVWTFGAASGFLPIASAPFDPIHPIAIAGKIVPIPINMAIANSFAVSVSIVLFDNYFFNKMRPNTTINLVRLAMFAYGHPEKHKSQH